jgi:hypothetical protein
VEKDEGEYILINMDPKLYNPLILRITEEKNNIYSFIENDKYLKEESNISDFTFF